MNKKGQELSLQTIIIAVLVVLVLIVVVTFFLGGFGRVTSTITSVFFPITSGTDQVIAVQTCEQRCDQARLLPTSTRPSSAFCKAPFNIDENGNGIADRVGEDDNDKKLPFKKFFCNKLNFDGNTEGNLGISCEVDDGQGGTKQLCD